MKLKRYLNLIFIIAMIISFQKIYASETSPEGMVLVPAGDFIMGATQGLENPELDELPAHSVYVPSFYIDKYEVTNLDYNQFIKVTGYRAPIHWVTNTYPEGKDNVPVYNIMWDDAVRYCTWNGKRLPTEAEWEKAARGTEERIYPWGNKFEANMARTMESGDGRSPVQVGSYESGKSPYGAYDMAGNVWEWTSSYYEPYDKEKGKNSELFGEKFRVIKGGSAHFNFYSSRTTNRNIIFPSYRYFLVGFRCAKE